MYRGPAGIDALNKMMQEILNPNDTGRRKEVKFNDKVYRIGDKILQLVNNPELNVFNGDMGEITSIVYAKESDDKVDELVIKFDANEVTYKRNEWNKITLSYCCSIHKSQGSEFKMVILPMVHNYGRMLRRDLLYTAITRSSELLILCGEISAFQESVEKSSATRLTTLKERLWDKDVVVINEEENKQEDKRTEELVTKERKSSKVTKEEISLFEESEIDTRKDQTKTYQLTIEMINKNTINPMIGMEGITP
jgi:exodeoxyribonuclease V alpha subunit